MVDEHGLVDVVRDQAPEEAARLCAKVESLEEALAVHAELLRHHAGDLLRGERTGCHGSDASKLPSRAM